MIETRHISVLVFVYSGTVKVVIITIILVKRDSNNDLPTTTTTTTTITGLFSRQNLAANFSNI